MTERLWDWAVSPKLLTEAGPAGHDQVDRYIGDEEQVTHWIVKYFARDLGKSQGEPAERAKKVAELYRQVYDESGNALQKLGLGRKGAVDDRKLRDRLKDPDSVHGNFYDLVANVGGEVGGLIGPILKRAATMAKGKPSDQVTSIIRRILLAGGMSTLPTFAKNLEHMAEDAKHEGFMREAKYPETAQEYAEQLNAESEEWESAGEDRWSSKLTTDPEHWAKMDVNTGEELAHNLVAASHYDMYKDVHGIRPRWMDYDSMTIDEIGKLISDLIEVEERGLGGQSNAQEWSDEDVEAEKRRKATTDDPLGEMEPEEYYDPDEEAPARSGMRRRTEARKPRQPRQMSARAKRQEEKTYPDTKKGVLQYLLDDTSFTREDLKDATAYPDPWVEGVWKVEFAKPTHDDAVAAIVYLAGYKDPFENLRPDNDFEVEYED